MVFALNKKENKLLIRLLEEVTELKTDMKYIRKHIETLNHEYGELVARVEKLEQHKASLQASWKTLVALGSGLVTVFTIIQFLLKFFL